MCPVRDVCISPAELPFEGAVTEVVMNADNLMRGLPGEEIIREGLRDYHSGPLSVAACLVAIARPRLLRAGLLTQGARAGMNDPELQLYRLLGAQKGDAYSRYNALLRELVSFEFALDRRLSRESRSVKREE